MVFVENLSEERRAPCRELLRGEILPRESLCEERRAPWRASLQRVKSDVDRVSTEREARRAEES
jgi:hypothetical protein